MAYALKVCVWICCNTLLAVIPVLLAVAIACGIRRDIECGDAIRWKLWAPLLFLWLVFLPNGAYLLTEWRHYLDLITSNPVYYQVYHSHHYIPAATAQLIGLTIFFAAYSAIGLAATGMAVWPLETLASRYFRTGPLLAAVFCLCSLGVYLGLVERLNSWQLMTPHTIADTVVSTIRVVTHPGLLCTVILFALFLRIVYAAFRVFVRGLQAGAANAPKVRLVG